jgi:hypothetical protein
VCLERCDNNEPIVSAVSPPPLNSSSIPPAALPLAGGVPSAAQIRLSIASLPPPSGASSKLFSKHVHLYFYIFVTSDVGAMFVLLLLQK